MTCDTNWLVIYVKTNKTVVYTIPFQPSDYSVICAAAFGPLGPVHMCLLMCLVPLPLFNQFIMLSVGLYSIRSGPSTLILTRLDKASCFMLVLAVILILLTELKPLSHSAVVSEIVCIYPSLLNHPHPGGRIFWCHPALTCFVAYFWYQNRLA